MPRFNRQKHRSTWMRIGIALISGLLGLVLSHIPHVPEPLLAQENTGVDIRIFPANTTTDSVPKSLEVGQSLYVQNCGSCHIALPPAVFPTQTWDQIIRDPSHYGAIIDPLTQPQQSWMRRYLIFASRLLKTGESTPYRFRQSRFFKILHYDVDLPSTVTSNTCISCHAKAPDFNFRE